MKINAIISALCVVGIIGALCSNGEEQHSVIEARPGTIPTQKVVYWSDLSGMKWDWGTQVTNAPGFLASESDPTVGWTNGTLYVHGDTIDPVQYQQDGSVRVERLALGSSQDGCNANAFGSLAVGGSTTINGAFASIATGWATASNQFTFVYGSAAMPGTRLYGDHGIGTFNVNPYNGTEGFWIGETNLATYLANAGGGVTSFAVGRNGTPYTGDVELVLTHADPNVTVTTNFSSGIKIGSLNYTHGFAELDLFNKGDPNATVDWNNAPVITDIYIPGNVSAFNNDVGYVKTNAVGSLVLGPYNANQASGAYTIVAGSGGANNESIDSIIIGPGSHIYQNAGYSGIFGPGGSIKSGSSYSFVFGASTVEASCPNSFVIGSSATSTNASSFLWTANSTGNKTLPAAKITHGDGTFNINTLDGVAGVYIGDTNLQQIIRLEARMMIAEALADIDTNIQTAEDARVALTNLITILKNL